MWDYPRPPRLEPVTARLARGARRRDDRRHDARLPGARDQPPAELLLPTRRRASRRARAGQGRVVLRVEGPRPLLHRAPAATGSSTRAAWGYDHPSDAFAADRRPRRVLRGPDGRLLRRRRGRHAPARGFYGGWITADVVGPFKGGPALRSELAYDWRSRSCRSTTSTVLDAIGPYEVLRRRPRRGRSASSQPAPGPRSAPRTRRSR